jgi:ribosomal protein S18 acetylase RimI-like enzyme
VIRPAIKSDSQYLAKLHAETLTTSFLAGLGINFLNSLYAFLIKNEKVWVYEDNNEVKGFVSFSRNSAGMMKRFMIKCPHCLVSLALKTIIHPVYFKRFIETFRVPFISTHQETVQDPICVPSGELLSISVSPDCQTSGIGSQLIKALEDYLCQNRISHYKVIAGEDLVGANKFYIKNGFKVAAHLKIHGTSISNVYVKEI